MSKQKQRLIEFDQYIGPDGAVYPLSDGINRFVMSFTGWGMPPVDYITQKGPFQHGETVLDYRLRPRVLQIVHRENSCSREAYWTNRNDLLDAIKPNRHSVGDVQPGQLRKILPSGAKRDLDVFISRGPSFEARNPGRWDEWAFTETLRFIAHNPLAYNPDLASYEFALAALTELEFAIEFPIEFGTSTLDESETITYNGTWQSFPTITIVGPIDNPVITNTSTSEKIELDYSISAGTTITITLDYGNKTVEDGSGSNLIATVSADSDLDTFHVAPDPEVVDGENTITVEGGGADADSTSVTISYYERFIGI